LASDIARDAAAELIACPGTLPFADDPARVPLCTSGLVMVVMEAETSTYYTL
jgi:hypothetical protein